MDQPRSVVVGDSSMFLALAAGPSLLLAGRWVRSVDGVQGEGVSKVGIRVCGLGVGQGLVRRWEVRGLKIRRPRVRERGSWTVQVLADG